MEALIFALMVAGIAMRKSAADIPFVIRGKTPPSHQRRMREMDAREAAGARRQANKDRRVKERQRRRNTPVRRYTRGVWDHAWEQAAARRVIRWQERDPIKAEAYRDKIRARQRGDLAGGFFPWAWRHSRQRATNTARRGWDSARERYRQARKHGRTTGRTTRQASDAATGGTAPTDEEIWDAEVVEDRPDDDPASHGDDDAGQDVESDSLSKPEDSAYVDQPYRDAYNAAMAATGNEGYAAFYADYFHKHFGHLPAETRPDPAYGPFAAVADIWREQRDRHQAPAPTPAPEPHHTEEGTHSMNTAGEVTGLTDALTLTESWERETGQAVSQLEAAIAALEGAEVGPEVTGPFATAMEAFTTAHQAFTQAKAGLQGSVNVGEAYQAAPGAGNKQFVTS